MANTVILTINCSEVGILLYDILCDTRFREIEWTKKESEVIGSIRDTLETCLAPEERIK